MRSILTTDKPHETGTFQSEQNTEAIEQTLYPGGTRGDGAHDTLANAATDAARDAGRGATGSAVQEGTGRIEERAKESGTIAYKGFTNELRNTIASGDNLNAGTQAGLAPQGKSLAGSELETNQAGVGGAGGTAETGATAQDRIGHRVLAGSDDRDFAVLEAEACCPSPVTPYPPHF